MANDQYKNMQSLSGPVSSAAPITYDADILTVSRCLYIGASGDVSVVMNDGSSVTFFGVNAGTILPIRVSKVLAAGTTVAASKILNLF